MEEQRKKLFQRVETDRGKVSWRGRQKNLCFSESFLRCPEAECKRDYVDTFPWVRTRVNDGSFVPRLPASAIPANTECKTRVNLNLVLACDLCKKSGKKTTTATTKKNKKLRYGSTHPEYMYACHFLSPLKFPRAFEYQSSCLKSPNCDLRCPKD
jgi:hypothetical protein